MPDSHEFITTVNQLLSKLNESGDLSTGLEIANNILKLLGTNEIEQVNNVIDEHVMHLPNAERYDHWFQNHPWMGGERAAFEVLDGKGIPIQGKFYWLKKRSRQFIAGGVHFTENWEDAPYTRNDNFKIGIDFFLAPNGKSLLVALSNRGNLRIVELQQKLNNTQVDIFTKWRDAVQISSIEALHTSLWDSFKLQSVNKEFYTGISNSFVELLQHLKDSGKNEESAKLFSSRLLGRLLFVWFLRKKNIINESMGYFDAGNASATDYYHKSLEQLFFNTLNVPIDERDEVKQETQKRLFSEADNDPQTNLFQTDQKTPYLNGGLFEPHVNDWYKDSSLTLPEGFFVNLYSHFDQFNFTTDESTPEYEQVAIDPEMLGQVFESLLATQVDETGQQARKAKGAFYTPREIVSYMCKESLRNYLYGVVADDDRYKKAIDDLLDRTDHEWAGAGTNSIRDAVPKEYRISIVDALDNVTVLDPACGSGAFPMGMLQLLTKTYERLEGRFDPYKTKLQIVQNNIFGVDIEPMAVEISRLRAWLSLIVDEADMQTVAPLPNLDFKFVCANSLIPLDDVQGLFSDTELHQKLKDIRVKYFNARVPKSKKKLQAEYYKLANSKQQLLIDDLRTSQLKSFDPFKNSQPAEFFDSDHMFGLSDGFDLIIGNPPYVFARKAGFTKSFKDWVAENYISGTSKINLFSLFMERGFYLLVEGGNLTYIIQNTFLRAAPYKKLREFLVNNSTINYILDLDKGVFDNVTASTTVISYSKVRPQNARVKVIKALDGILATKNTVGTIDQTVFNNPEFVFSLSEEKNTDLLRKISHESEPLSTLCKEIINGIVTPKGKSDFISDNKEDNRYKPLIEGKSVHRYLPVFQNKYILFDRKSLHRARPDYVWEAPEKIIIRRISGGKTPLISSYDKKNFYTFASTNNIILKDESWASMKYILALLNSNLLNWYYVQKFTNGSTLTVNISKTYLNQLPIKHADKSTQAAIIQVVDEAIDLQTQDPETDITKQLLLINQLIYDLYDLSTEEVQVIEDSLK